MRPLWIVLLLVPLVALFLWLNRFSRDEVDRVEVHAPGMEALHLSPGAVQSLPWRRGQAVTVAAFIGQTQVCEGRLTDIGMGLAYHQRSQTKNIEAEQRGGNSLELSLANVDLKTGTVTRQRFLRAEARGEVLRVEFPAARP